MVVIITVDTVEATVDTEVDTEADTVDTEGAINTVEEDTAETTDTVVE